MTQTIPVDIEIQWVPGGLSGFAFEVAVEDPAIARIQAASLPAYGFQFANGTPGPSASILAVDFNDLLDGAITSAVLLTLDVELLATGSTQLLLTLNQLDNDSGVNLVPVAVITPGTLIVN